VPERADVVVKGGGCSGTSIALQLARRRAGHIVLLERDGQTSTHWHRFAEGRPISSQHNYSVAPLG